MVKIKNLKIGLDIDDTIANTHFILMKYAVKYNEENVNRNGLLKYATNNFSEAFNWTEEEVYGFFRSYYLDALKQLEPKYGVRETLQKLREEGHKIILITIRNDKECNGEGEARRITEEWLHNYQIPYDELNIGISDKREFCMNNNIDAFMDDSEKHCEAVSSLGIKTFMAANSFNLEYKNHNIPKIYSMVELYDKINEEFN